MRSEASNDGIHNHDRIARAHHSDRNETPMRPDAPNDGINNHDRIATHHLNRKERGMKLNPMQILFGDREKKPPVSCWR